MSQDQFIKLSEDIDRKFDRQFIKLFKYVNRRFDAIDARLDQMVTKTEFNVFINAVDAFAKHMEIYDHERLALGHQVDRHERWHHQTAKACGIKLQA